MAFEIGLECDQERKSVACDAYALNAGRIMTNTISADMFVAEPLWYRPMVPAKLPLNSG